MDDQGAGDGDAHLLRALLRTGGGRDVLLWLGADLGRLRQQSVTQIQGGTVILSAADRVLFRVKGDGVPVRVGHTVFVPTQREIIGFRVP